MSQRKRLAAAIAEALLGSTQWTVESLADRIRSVAGVDEPWVTALARAATYAYPSPPYDAPAELTRFVLVVDEYAELWEDRDLAPGEVAIEPATRRLPDRPARHSDPLRMADSSWPVPRIDTVAELARWLGLTDSELDWFADRRDYTRAVADGPLQHYRHTWLPTRSGGIRLLESPKWRLRGFQRQLLHELLAAIPVHPAAHGFVAGRSVLTAAAPHIGAAVVIRLDLESFFAAVSAPRIVGLLRLAGYAEPVADRLAALVTAATPVQVLSRAPTVDRPELLESRRRLLGRLAGWHLPQGAPTSPALANLVAFRLDRRVAGLAAAFGATYTRYADDLILSGGLELRGRVDRLVGQIGEIAAAEGFRVAAHKTRVAGRGQRQAVLGLVVNDRLSIARTEIDRLRAILHNCERRGPASQNRAGVADFRAHLLGRVAWVAAVHPERGARLRSAYDRIDWG